MVDSELVVGVTPGDSGVVTGCQVENFKCIWSVECLLLDHKLTLGSFYKVSTLAYFSLEPS